MNGLDIDYGRYIDMISRMAGKIVSKFGGNGSSIDDLISAGYLGLCEAVNKYNPDMGVAFSTFSYHRIWGAMIDEQRFQFWNGGRSKTFKGMMYFESLIVDGIPVIDWMPAEVGNPQDYCDYNDGVRFLLSVIDKLSDQQRKVIIWYYFDDMTLIQIAKILGLTKARISQIRGDALNRLRNLIKRRNGW